MILTASRETRCLPRAPAVRARLAAVVAAAIIAARTKRWFCKGLAVVIATASFGQHGTAQAANQDAQAVGAVLDWLKAQPELRRAGALGLDAERSGGGFILGPDSMVALGEAKGMRNVRESEVLNCDSTVRNSCWLTGVSGLVAVMLVGRDNDELRVHAAWKVNLAMPTDRDIRRIANATAELRVTRNASGHWQIQVLSEGRSD